MKNSSESEVLLMRAFLDEIREINLYIKKNFLKLSVILFILNIVISVVSYYVVLSFPPERMETVIQKLAEMFNADNMPEKQGFSFFWSLFVHNLRVCGMNIMSFIIPFMLFPIQSLVTSGVSSGMVFAMGTYMGVEDMFLSFLKFVLPHSIFEIPIFILSCAMGLKYSWLIIKKLFRKAKGESLKYHYMKMSSILTLYVIPFLLLSAFLEGIVENWLFG